MAADGEPTKPDPNFDEEVVKRAEEIVNGLSNQILDDQFHETQTQDHARTIGELANNNPFAPPPSSREAMMDRADATYAALHDAGKIDQPFEYPSVAARRLQRESVEHNRPPVMSDSSSYQTILEDLRSRHTDPDPEFTEEYRMIWSHTMSDAERRDYRARNKEKINAYHERNELQREKDRLEAARIMMSGLPIGAAAIHEEINDNDALDPSHETNWLRCDDPEDAARYVYRVGTGNYEPGPGEYDGISTSRTIYIKDSDQAVHEARHTTIIPPDNYYR